jgi:hypothetical protein
MKRPFIPLILIAVGLLALAACISPALSQVPGGSISGRIQTNTATFPNNTFVELVNPANYSEEYTQYNTTPDNDGFFQFTNVSFGDYSVFAYAPYYSWGLSSPLHITDNTTYTASVIMLAEPVFADFNPGSVVVSYNGVSEINVTIYDHWGNVVPTWYIVLQSSSGKQPDPSAGYTDKNGNFKSSIPYQENVGQPAVTAWAKAANGSYYELQGGELPTVTPSATPSTIASNNTSNATVTASPNSTAPVNATVTVVATGKPSAVPMGTAKPTPGFELIAGILAICIAIAISKIK